MYMSVICPKPTTSPPPCFGSSTFFMTQMYVCVCVFMFTCVYGGYDCGPACIFPFVEKSENNFQELLLALCLVKSRSSLFFFILASVLMWVLGMHSANTVQTKPRPLPSFIIIILFLVLNMFFIVQILMLLSLCHLLEFSSLTRIFFTYIGAMSDHL